MLSHLIKIYSSVSCGPRSWRTTPVSILTGRTIMQFLRIHNFLLLVRNRMIFAVKMPSTTFKISTKSCQIFPRYELSKIGLVSSFIFLFFSSFHLGMKITIKWKRVIWLPWNLVHRKVASWYQVWLEYDKHSQGYSRLFMKNNTNMLSCPQGKPHMARSWKVVQR